MNRPHPTPPTPDALLFEERIARLDRAEGGDETVYSIPHKLAFEMLERQICAQFHPSGSFQTQTRAEVTGSEIKFIVNVKRLS